ncbi:hypothetical protein [Vibrio phage J14]|nr:hypothetical protein [Vibrio phage J14]
MVYNPMTTKHVFGNHVLPRKLTRLLDVMQKAILRQVVRISLF